MTTKVSEEKLLNEMFVLLEYSDSFYEFVEGLSIDAYRLLSSNMKLKELKDFNKMKGDA